MQLHHPAGAQLENTEPGHRRIGLICFARLAGPTKIGHDFSEDKVGWYGPEDWDAMRVNLEVEG